MRIKLPLQLAHQGDTLAMFETEKVFVAESNPVFARDSTAEFNRFANDCVIHHFSAPPSVGVVSVGNHEGVKQAHTDMAECEDGDLSGVCLLMTELYHFRESGNWESNIVANN